MAFTVIYDACVLYPAPLRDFLMRIAITGPVRAKWTETILDECFSSLQKHRPDVSPKVLDRTRQLMIDAIPDCLVSGFEPLIDALSLPDANDRHVVAAAIRCGAQAIVTFNLKDFPESSLRTYGIEAMDPDDYCLDLIDLAPNKICAVMEEQTAALKNPPRSLEEVLDTLELQGLPQSVAKLRELLL